MIRSTGKLENSSLIRQGRMAGKQKMVISARCDDITWFNEQVGHSVGSWSLVGLLLISSSLAECSISNSAGSFGQPVYIFTIYVYYFAHRSSLKYGGTANIFSFHFNSFSSTLYSLRHVFMRLASSKALLLSLTTSSAAAAATCASIPATMNMLSDKAMVVSYGVSK